MSFTLKDALNLLPAVQPPPKKLDKGRLKVLAKRFAPHVSEPKNTGVEKKVGPKMIREVAKSVAKRQRRA